MESSNYQNINVSMPYLLSTISQAIAASEDHSPSLQDLLEYDGMMPVDGEFFGQDLLQREGHSSLSSLSSSSSSSSLQAQWFDPNTLSDLCFLPSPASPNAQLLHQQQQQLLEQQQQQAEQQNFLAHDQQLHPHQHGHFRNHHHQPHQPQQQQQHQLYRQQQAPQFYSHTSENPIMQQQPKTQLQLHIEQQQLYTEKDVGSLQMCPPISVPSQDFSPTMIPLPHHYPTKALLNRAGIPMTQLSMDLSAYRSVSFDRLSSPEAPSPISDPGCFDVTTDDEAATGCYSTMMMPSRMHPNSNNNNSNKNDTIAMEQLNISGLTSTTSPQRRRRTPPSLVHKSAPTATLEQIMLLSPNATAALTAGPTMKLTSLSSSSPSLSTIPALSSPLKQHFSFSSSSSDSDSHEEEEERVIKTGSSSPSSSRPAAAKKKRERKPSKSGHNKPKHPLVKLPCHFPGCSITCSSQPSLARHAEAHKWRGLYAPVRCEACQAALSNEFSVQRHIVRSSSHSMCRRLRVYSIMMSETEIETSVRFYPKRAHGKKTVEIDLDYARARYLGDSP